MTFEEAIIKIKKRAVLSDEIEPWTTLKPDSDGDGFVGPCPFHEETSPSFHVRDDKGYFKCFGCGVSGDVITFHERIANNQNTSQVVRMLAKKLKIKIE